MLSLHYFRDTNPGMPDLINYAALIAPGVVQGKDGSLMAGFFFHGEDSANSTNAEKNYITEIVNKYLNFDSGWSLWVDASRIPSPDYIAADRSFFPDAITALIDAERREMFEREGEHFETDYALILQYSPPLSRRSKIGEMFYDDDTKGETSLGDRLLAEFQKRMADFEEGLKSPLRMYRMGETLITLPNGDSYKSDELVNYLHYALTGEAVALRIPSNPMFMDQWLGIPDMYPGNTPKVGTKFVACVAIDGFPAESYPGILSVLDGLPVAYRWSTRFIFLEQHETISSLDSYRRKWQQKIRGFWKQIINTNDGQIDIDALKMMKEVDLALGDARSGLVAHGYYTPVVVLMSEDRGLLERQAAYVKKEIEKHGFAARVEEENAVEAWYGSLPGHSFPNVRRPLIHTLNLADLLPLSGIWPGLLQNPCSFYPEGSPPLMQTITAGSTPFRFNAHVDDNGHVAVFGPVGSGKSVLLVMMAAQFRRYRSKPRPDGSTVPATITVFDKGRSMYTLCKAVGGHHYDIGEPAGTQLVLCPLADLESEKAILWAVEWVETCCMLQSKDKQTRFTPAQRNAVNRALNNMSLMPKDSRSLTEFKHLVQDPEVRGAMEHYAIRGGMGHLLGGKSESEEESNFVVYEIDELMKLGDENVIPVLLCLFRRFEKSLTGQPAMLILDEAWMVFRHPVFREFLRKWWKELRKQNCSVVVATQSLSDAVNSELLDVLIEQCATKILLPNNEADAHGTKEHPGPHEFYTMFGLNDQEIQHIKNAEYKKQYYYKSDLGRRMFELGLGPLTKSFVAVSDKDTLREVRACEEKHGKDWPIHWLNKRGVNYAKYLKQTVAG